MKLCTKILSIIFIYLPVSFSIYGMDNSGEISLNEFANAITTRLYQQIEYDRELDSDISQKLCLMTNFKEMLYKGLQSSTLVGEKKIKKIVEKIKFIIVTDWNLENFDTLRTEIDNHLDIFWNQWNLENPQVDFCKWITFPSLFLIRGKLLDLKQNEDIGPGVNSTHPTCYAPHRVLYVLFLFMHENTIEMPRMKIMNEKIMKFYPPKKYNNLMGVESVFTKVNIPLIAQYLDVKELTRLSLVNKNNYNTIKNNKDLWNNQIYKLLARHLKVNYYIKKDNFQSIATQIYRYPDQILFHEMLLNVFQFVE